MRDRQKALCAVYGVISLLALIFCWRENWHYMGQGILEGNAAFWADTLVNHASRSITFDIGFFFLAASVWMLTEAKRLKIRHAWAYIVFGLIVAISVTFPLFLIARERKIRA